MSIFIAMPTMHDTEFEITINDAYRKASNPSDINFGIRSLYSDPREVDKLNNMKNKYGKRIRGYGDVITDENRLDKIGTGHARKAVSDMYMGEDYILSIDSHTLFIQDWDKILIEMYEEASQLTNNSKTIITAYPSKYKYVEKGIRKFVQDNMLYPYIGWEKYWTYEEFPFLRRPLWQACLPYMVFPLEGRSEKYLPSGKFSYNFSFSKEMFLYEEDTEIVIMEEDICKTFKLLNDGWDLVHPNINKPIVGHLYLTEISVLGGGRASYTDFLGAVESGKAELKELENFNRYYHNPELLQTIEKYEKWMNIDFKEKSLHNFHIPESWFQSVGC